MKTFVPVILFATSIDALCAAETQTNNIDEILASKPTITQQKMQLPIVAGASTTDDAAVIKQMIAAQLSKCWSDVPKPDPKLKNLPIVQVELKRDGSLAKEPRLLNSDKSVNFNSIAGSGIKAIQRCSPFIIPKTTTDVYDQ